MDERTKKITELIALLEAGDVYDDVPQAFDVYPVI